MSEDPTQDPVEPDDAPQPWWNPKVTQPWLSCGRVILVVLLIAASILKDVPRARLLNSIGGILIVVAVVGIALGSIWLMNRLALDSSRRL